MMGEVQTLSLYGLIGEKWKYRARCDEHGFKGTVTESFQVAEDELDAHEGAEHGRSDTP